MAKRAAITVAPIVPTKIKLTTWGSGQTMYRVHDAIYAVDQFNPSPKGNARFSPILDPSGNVIPTLYAATTPRGALMESVFRDIPYRTGFKHVDARRLEGRVCSTLLFQTDFQLLDLSKVALRGLGIPPRQLIDTTKAHYPATRGWAEQVYAAHPKASGISLVFAAGRPGARGRVVREPGTSHRTSSMPSSRARSSGTAFLRTLSSSWRPT